MMHGPLFLFPALSFVSGVARPPSSAVAWRHSPLRATVSPPQESSASPAVETEEEPGQNEKALFRCDPSCAMWEDFQRQETPDAVANLQAAASTVAKYMPGPFDGLGGADALSYWAKHAARTGYFLTNALAGTAAHSVEQRRSAGGSDGGLGYGGFAGMGIDPAVASRLVLEAVLTYEQDWQRIRDGAYSPPWDMEVGHRQSTLPFALRQSARFVQEAVGTLARRTRGTPEDRTIWLDSSTKLYPDYYKTNFHYQTDGWMSARSAAVYETSTETLFLGRQDAMQRASLVPLQGLKPLDGRKAPRVLEVACGTGRFATFLRDNHPTAELTCVDLSPFYLAAAKENDEYWRRFKGRRQGGSSTSTHAPATFVQAAAEALPFEDECFDAVVCVYLFHEMPEEARAEAAKEMARVLAPGGTLVLTDSMQRGDRPALDEQLVNFENLNEPHYRNYISTRLADLFVPHGLECGQKLVSSSSKTLSFTKSKGGPDTSDDP